MQISNEASARVSHLVPDTAMCRAVTEFIRKTESELLFNHSSRVYLFGTVVGQKTGTQFDKELLYAAAMFHDVGLVPAHSSESGRFEIDGANAAKAFLQGYGISAPDLEIIWAAIALHTTPEIPHFLNPIIALTTAGVEFDVLGIGFEHLSTDETNAIITEFPRPVGFKEQIIQAFYDGIKHKPSSTFGNVKSDVIADKDPHFHPGNFCTIIRDSAWPN